ncbi:MAG: dUTP diphosphatase [Cetobacterium sp.]
MIKCYQDVLKLQKQLDEAVGKPRENGFVQIKRTVNHIVRSAIAECIELDEEMEQTHKTWKPKEISRQNQLQELTDILFFLAQWCNEVDKMPHAFNFIKAPTIYESAILRLIKNCACKDLERAVSAYMDLIDTLGYTDNDIFTEYYRKWNINFTRIEKDWR